MTFAEMLLPPPTEGRSNIAGLLQAAEQLDRQAKAFDVQAVALAKGQPSLAANMRQQAANTRKQAADLRAQAKKAGSKMSRTYDCGPEDPDALVMGGRCDKVSADLRRRWLEDVRRGQDDAERTLSAARRARRTRVAATAVVLAGVGWLIWRRVA